MSLNLLCSRLTLPSSHKFHYYSSPSTPTTTTTTLFYLFFPNTSAKKQLFSTFSTPGSAKDSSENAKLLVSQLLDDELLNWVSSADDAAQALDRIAERTSRSSGVVSCSDCALIISAAIARGNADLALSVFSAMRSSFDSSSDVGDKGPAVERWRWSRPDVNTYTSLIQGLASSLRVSDALRIITSVCRVGVSPVEEVPFGKVVRCPSCMVAVAVAQPQHGIQIVSCSKCRYQYELVSGTICNIESEEIRISYCRTQHGCSSMEEGAKVFANHEAECSSCCSLNCGGDPIWYGTDAQVCY